MRVSVIIPVYNVSRHIERCLVSVFNQTYKNIEIIIVNDKTQDNSMEIIRNMTQNKTTACTIKIIEHKENRGLSAARNTGIKNSSGDYLYFLDSDDEITTDCIEKLSNQALFSKADIVIGDYMVKGSDSFYPPLKLETSIIKGSPKIIQAYMREKIYVMAWNKLVKKTFILNNNLFFKDGLIHEDCLWSFQCACKAEIVAIEKNITYIYKIQKESITSTVTFEKNFNAHKTILEDMANYANSLNLLDNKYVFSFIEEEKLRLLYQCKAANGTEYIHILYTTLRSIPQSKRYKILLWEFFNTRKFIRDAHYFLPAHCAENYYNDIINIYSKYKYKRIRFYIYIMHVLICSFVDKQKK